MKPKKVDLYVDGIHWGEYKWKCKLHGIITFKKKRKVKKEKKA